jgi:DNA topoisomerase-3
MVAVLPDMADLAPAEGKLVFRKGAKGHYVKDPGEHHAIVPLRKVPQRGSISGDHLRLWELVTKSFLAAHLPDGVDARTTVSTQVATPLGPKRFAVSGSVIRVPGWRAVYGAETEEEPDFVPGKAKADEEPTAGRLPLIQDQEPGRAAEARIEAAKTEPPRRITRGELPVVMGKLIDQVDDPRLKAALENPANPNEPKGLGTAATRDTILPKLEKSRYVELLRGKDPPIQVTEIGLTFIDAVRRVFPAYGDPVGRAIFEAELAEIGRAQTREEALRRAAAFQERTQSRVRELIAAIAHSRAVAVDLSGIPASASPGEDRPPTPAMLAFATSLATRHGLKLPRGLKSKSSVCRTFLDQHAPPRASGSGDTVPDNGPRPPSDAMVRYARSLAQEKGIACPAEVTTDFAACRTFLDQHVVKRSSSKITGEAAGAGGRRAQAPERENSSSGKRQSGKRSPDRVNVGARRRKTARAASSTL